MLNKIFKVVLALALVVLVLYIVPVTYDWFRTALLWIITQGKWGVISIIVFLVLGIYSLFE